MVKNKIFKEFLSDKVKDPDIVPAVFRMFLKIALPSFFFGFFAFYQNHRYPYPMIMSFQSLRSALTFQAIHGPTFLSCIGIILVIALASSGYFRHNDRQTQSSWSQPTWPLRKQSVFPSERWILLINSLRLKRFSFKEVVLWGQLPQ